MDISSEKAIEFNDWLEQKWLKEITKYSSWNKWKNGGRILKIWKAGNTENYKEKFYKKNSFGFKAPWYFCMPIFSICF